MIQRKMRKGQRYAVCNHTGLYCGDLFGSSRSDIFSCCEKKSSGLFFRYHGGFGNSVDSIVRTDSDRGNGGIAQDDTVKDRTEEQNRRAKNIISEGKFQRRDKKAGKSEGRTAETV